MALSCQCFMTKGYIQRVIVLCSIAGYCGNSCTPSNACSAGTTDAAGTTGNAGNYGNAGASGTHGTTDTYKIMNVITILWQGYFQCERCWQGCNNLFIDSNYICM